jgi:2-amino-4-hydroxy-6-hydroxymethyldihydropteridine diphosphokinase
LGSNLGNREQSILEAVRRLQDSGVPVVAVSGLYETAPAEGAQGNEFINAVVEVRPLLCPGDLLKRLKTIERTMGRTSDHNQPREIDIDIVSYGDTVVEEADLTIPHPRFGKRAFVLLPLQEIAPNFCCPLTGRRLGQLIESLREDQAISRVSGRSIIATTSP